jgi:hypothetical protein
MTGEPLRGWALQVAVARERAASAYEVLARLCFNQLNYRAAQRYQARAQAIRSASADRSRPPQYDVARGSTSGRQSRPARTSTHRGNTSY